ncbi:Zinc carboxypeptidase [Candidatus Kryptonium thompsonii]|uniref:Zinc carboxypeptidase n=1 Tax=Candidatus Kryptonium thompsonii TaxID=1633631 RepID=A0A0P1LIT4_9BACT|nr:M14 family metallopeptidase [Candidatus Kryptonium thompsoni]CUS78377.1 Zinc carboxypeptidase [Candidatus Kryptonium thompsoni]CUS81022.1 Zinc carboxypeptidase [Candidatus Kryptonium thompsoni]CUS89534.1 Zinc carboxypeptidase [Candidatus Kryptonium thompsoni]CUS90647.1 Zinc carboxypeptidase [Candidatus Kryptonium thompsoni]CUT00263.1 Zinc carboxypeptidase [Candidatus Kryptonium thompsoni]
MLVLLILSLFWIFNPEKFPKSRPEITDYKQTSTYSDVINFVEQITRSSSIATLSMFGKSYEGRDLPLVILSKPKVSKPEDESVRGKFVVLIIGNIHGGEVEGKEAILHLLRKFHINDEFKKMLDKIVVLAVPILNADGNEKISRENRPHQNGPEFGVGVRENSQGLDLNRDFTKLETPEIKALIEDVINKWNPHLVIDCHTTDGSYHGYVLTYATGLNPNGNSKITSFVKDKLFAEVTDKMWRKYGYRIYYYGNFIDPLDPSKGWITFDHRPRFGTNYVGLINRFAILSEAYVYADFKTRIDATEKFIEEILRFVVANREEMLNLIKEADELALSGGVDSLGIRFQIKEFDKLEKIYGYRVIEYVDTLTGEKKRKVSDKLEIFEIKNFGEFKITEKRKVPIAYVFSGKFKNIAEKLIEHGIRVEHVKDSFRGVAEVFVVDSLKHSERKFQGHNEARLFGHYETRDVEIEGSYYYVSTRQPKVNLIFYLLEPESDDGFVNWNFFDDFLIREINENGTAIFPVFKIF